jgi:hypothetical protein
MGEQWWRLFKAYALLVTGVFLVATILYVVMLACGGER